MKRFKTYQPLLFLRWGFLFLVLYGGLFLAGCGSSSPRFTGDHKKTESKKEEKKTGSVRFSSKEAEEEKKEDDKKVDINDAAQRFKAKKSIEKSAPKQEPQKKSPDVKISTEFSDQKMMDAILAWIGTPYEYGGETKNGIDCSAFTREIFKTSASIELPRTTEEQVRLGKPVDKDNLKFGDLLFFNTSGQNPSHVGIYIGDDMFAHASVSSGVTLSSLYSSYFKKRYTEARRVLQ